MGLANMVILSQEVVATPMAVVVMLLCSVGRSYMMPKFVSFVMINPETAFLCLVVIVLLVMTALSGEVNHMN